MADPAANPTPTPTGTPSPLPSSAPAFDVDGARKAGYSDDEILQHLTQSRNFDVPGALKAGYSKQDIIGHLSSSPSVSNPSASNPSTPQVVKRGNLNVLQGTNPPAPPEPATSYITPGLLGGTHYNAEGVPIDANTGKPLDRRGLGGKGTALFAPPNLPMSHGVYDPNKSPEEKVLRPTVGEVAGGAADIAHGNVQQGAHRVISGTGAAALPLLPAAFGAAPVKTLLSLGAAYAGGKAARGVTGLITDNPNTQDLAEDAGNIIAGGLTAKNLPSSGSLARDSAIYNLRKAVNPVATEAPGFLKEVGDQLDTVVGHAKQTGAKVQNLGDLENVVRDAAAADPYRKTFIDPYADEHVSTTQIPAYKGGTSTHNTATIGQLDSRLHTINSTLTPKYARGGAGSVQAQAAVSAEEAVALQAEGAGIRNTLAQELSRRTGVAPEDIAAARRNYGQLNDLADTVRYYNNEAQHAANKAANGPVKLTINPFSNTKDFVVDAALNKGVNAVRGNPANKAISSVFSKYEPTPNAPPTITPPPPPAPRVPYARTSPLPAAAVPEPIAAAMSSSATRPPTVRAQRAATAAAQARQAATAASATPPNAAGAVEQVGQTNLTPEQGPLATPGGATVVRSAPALPPPPAANAPALPADIERAIPLPASNPDLNAPREIPRNVQEGAVPNIIRNFTEGKGTYRGNELTLGHPVSKANAPDMLTYPVLDASGKRVLNIHVHPETGETVVAPEGYAPGGQKATLSPEDALRIGRQIQEDIGGKRLFGKASNERSAARASRRSIPAAIEDVINPEPRVDVIAPDGTLGDIPQSQLTDALHRGYTLKNKLQ